MRVSEKGTKQYYPRQVSADGSRFQVTKPCNGERAREPESQRESGEDEEKRGRKAAKSGAKVSGILTLRPTINVCNCIYFRLVEFST
jgi:hypothetical protein